VTHVQQIQAFVNDKIKPNEGITLRIRWNVYRGGLGKYTPETDLPEENLIIQRFMSVAPIKQRAFISKNIKLYPTPWSQCKTLNALCYVMANRERVHQKMDEVILLDGDGYLSEAGSSNLFWQKGNTLYTPDLMHNAIRGVARSVIIEHAPSIKFNVVVGSFKPEELFQANRLFTTNVTGISYIDTLENKQYETDGLEELNSLFPYYFKPKPQP
jgi:4-amino-4-deoxychorismate lyase